MLKLILHNILKHKFLFFLFGVLVVVFVFYLMVGLNVLAAVSRSLEISTSENMTGDLLIFPREKKRWDVMTLDGEREVIPLSRWKELVLFLESSQDVEAVSPRLRRWAWMNSDHSELPMILVGVDPEREKNLLVGRSLAQGRWIQEENEALVYYRHADLLYAKVGEILRVGVMTLDGYNNFDMLRLCGILDYEKMETYSDFALYCLVPLSFLSRLVGSEETLVTEVWVKLKDPGKRGRLIREIRRAFPGYYRFVKPVEAANLLAGVSSMTRLVILSVMGMLLVLVFVCSSFLIHFSLESRRYEIGVYHALGVPRWRMVLLFGGELLVAMVICGALGIWMGVSVLQSMAGTGIEATILPLQVIFGARFLRIAFFPEALWMTGVLLGVVLVGNVLFAFKKLLEFDPLLLLREL